MVLGVQGTIPNGRLVIAGRFYLGLRTPLNRSRSESVDVFLVRKPPLPTS